MPAAVEGDKQISVLDSNKGVGRLESIWPWANALGSPSGRRVRLSENDERQRAIAFL